MATNFPTSLDTGLTVGDGSNPSAAEALSSTVGQPAHSGLHQNLGLALTAIETKVGTGDSNAVASSVLAGTGSGTSGWTTGPTVVSLAVTGDATFDTSTLHVDSTNNRVGIGTTAPDEVLHAEGGTPTLLVADTGNNYAQGNVQCEVLLKGRYHSGTADPTANLYSAAAIKSFKDNSDGNGGAGMSLWTSATGSGGLTQKVTIDKAGKVGIGTTSPNHSLSFGSPANGTKSLALWENGTAFYGLGNDTNRLAFYASNASGTAERMVINSDGKVGIGTTAPTAPLHILNGVPNIYIQDSDHAASVDGAIYWFGSTGVGLARAGLEGTDDFRIYSANSAGTGEIYFNICNDWRYFMDTFAFCAYYDNTIDLGKAGRRWNDAYVTNGVTTGSDERDKKDITDLDLGLDFINQLRPVSWVWNERSGQVGVREHMGLVAQELAAVLGDQATNRGVWINSPASSVEGADGEIIESPDHQGIRYSELFGPLIKAVQELSTRVDALETVYDALEARIEALEA